MSAKPEAARAPLIEIKGATLPAFSALLRSADPDELAPALHALLAQTPDFFAGEAMVLDFRPLAAPPTEIDWPALLALFHGCKLVPVAVRHLPQALAEQACARGLAVLPEQRTNARASAEAAAPAAAERATAKPAGASPPVAALTPAVTTMVVDRPLRSGQQVYARGGDLVLLAMVSAGAEVIADGSIHVYAALRGRALAGASGNSAARIFTTSFAPELVSIAGVYRTFDAGLPELVARRPAQVSLQSDGAQHSLSIAPLSTG